MPHNNGRNHLIYLDHAATTPVRAEVRKAMEPYWSEMFGNPSSLYRLGLEARAGVELAREHVAQALHAKSKEIIFTAGGTESINIALQGVARMFDPAIKPWHIITTVVEHAAVLNTCKNLQRRGFAVTYLPVDGDGRVSLNALRLAVRPETILVSVMMANNEIGTIEPVEEIGAWLKKYNHQHRLDHGLLPIRFHSDACQATGYLNIDVGVLGVDLLTINSSKIYGPKQAGTLYVREGVELKPLLLGGGQERNIRSGTENVPGIVGFATALTLAQQERVSEHKRVRALRNYLHQRILETISDAHLNGPMIGDPNIDVRLPNNLNMSFRRVDAEALLLYLDTRGVCVSTGSACSSQSTLPSHVLTSIGCPDDYIGGSIRFTLGRSTTKEDIDAAVSAVADGVSQLRSTNAVTFDIARIAAKSLGGGCTDMKP